MPVYIQPATMKYKDGSIYHGADCLKGDKGDKGDPGDKGEPGNATIDDTAGKGDTTKVWSADKSISAMAVTVLSPIGNVHILDPCPVTYSFGEKSMLTVTVTATTQYHFMFTCPNDAPTDLVMHGIVGTAGNTLEGGKTYEVDIWAGIALIREIEVTPVT